MERELDNPITVYLIHNSIITEEIHKIQERETTINNPKNILENIQAESEKSTSSKKTVVWDTTPIYNETYSKKEYDRSCDNIQIAKNKEKNKIRKLLDNFCCMNNRKQKNLKNLKKIN
jgi:hypothetical protein